MQLNPLDIHNHLLPGVDDGFGSAGESLEAISRISGSGISDHDALLAKFALGKR